MARRVLLHPAEEFNLFFNFFHALGFGDWSHVGKVMDGIQNKPPSSRDWAVRPVHTSGSKQATRVGFKRFAFGIPLQWEVMEVFQVTPEFEGKSTSVGLRDVVSGFTGMGSQAMQGG